MKKQVLFAAAVLLSAFISAQHTNVLISNSNAPEEPSIYVNPTNTDHLVGGANINNVYYSNDGGLTWNVSTLQSQQQGVWGDPCTIVDTAGHCYFFHLAWPQSGSWIDRIVCQKSTDGGATWNDGTYMGLNGTKAQDKEWAVVDRTNNNIYVTWTQFDDYGSANPNDLSIIRFSKSADGGETWSEAVKINEVDGDCIDSDNTVEGAVPAVGPNGEIYVSWAGPEGLVFDRSPDEGETWLENDIFVSDFPGGWDYNIPGIMRCNGLPITVCDLSSGPYHGNIYINWSDQRNGADDTDVWLAKSTDGGDSWSEPIRVNDDGAGKHQFFTWMAIDQVTGYLWFIWYDRREYTDSNTDVYMAVSTDGGDSFINFKVSETPFLPYSGVFFGDYNNVSAHNNVVRPIWTRLHDGDLSVWTAIVDVDAVITTGQKETSALPVATLEPNYPNPFHESTFFSFKLREPATVTLRVYDMFGREVATLFSREARMPGKYVEHFDASGYHLSQGVYYFTLSGENLLLKRKMMLVR
ncbi:MAG: T9SS type A sorting domain-containing protein [Bacteroidales bacterium]|nr:T9SS type A sorting domain-containing protein [Bacteroidales bacterium]